MAIYIMGILNKRNKDQATLVPSSYLLEGYGGRGTGMAGGRAGDDQRGVRVKHLGFG